MPPIEEPGIGETSSENSSVIQDEMHLFQELQMTNLVTAIQLLSSPAELNSWKELLKECKSHLKSSHQSIPTAKLFFQISGKDEAQRLFWQRSLQTKPSTLLVLVEFCLFILESMTGRLVQQIGRALREHPDKEDAVVYDFVDHKVGVLRRQWMQRTPDVQEVENQNQARIAWLRRY
jgi:hypothetical protein